jgi:uncharacterized sulfatase
MFGRHTTKHDPGAAVLPPYHPDHPKVREDWAKYHDNITKFDSWVANHLARLADARLAENTIVFVYGDHGAGMPRGKRWLYDSGMRVPLIIYFPKNFRHLAPGSPGSRTDRLVSFVDFGPTVLSLAGVEVPAYMHGRPFLGEQETEPRAYVFGIRGRIDERYDMVRAVSDGRYKYIRNYFPHKTYALHVGYMYRMETMQVWDRLFHEGKLNEVQSQFFAAGRPVEELYDTHADPHEMNNLADQLEHQATLNRFRKSHVERMRRTRDVGLLPEPEIKARPERDGFSNAFDWARSDMYPQEAILSAAMRVGERKSRDRMIVDLDSPDPAVRFWAVIGLRSLGAEARPAVDKLIKKLKDVDPSVATEAAELLARLGHAEQALPVLTTHLRSDNEYVALRAANAIDHLDQKARPLMPVVRKLAPKASNYPKRVLQWVINEESASAH